jgi:DNA polymerase-3 subunit gamma/tau
MAQQYQPLATKYRPQHFSDVVGQEVATRTLQNAIKAGRISHAYIFSGMRGVGKTTTARLLAKCLNCHNQDSATIEPCGECESCSEISAGRSMDVLEIDAASNTSVDDVRALQENLMYSPARDRYKVYIVDEVHMLSKSAFNAFLKTLEEPPKHVVFIFATTELNKIPPTVLSRCLVFEFGRVSGTAIKNRLAWICDQEGVTAEEAALDLIVFQSEGSIRDAISALDQVINFAEGNLSYESAMQALGLIDRDILKQMMAAVIEQNSAAAFEAVQRVAHAGADMRLFCRHSIRHVRDLLVARTMGAETPLLPYSNEETNMLVEQAEKISEEDLSRFFDILVKTDQDMQFSATPQYLLEAALVKMIHSTRLLPLTELIASLQDGSLSVSDAPSPGYSTSGSKQESTISTIKPTGSAASSIKDPKQRLLSVLDDHRVKAMLRTAAVREEEGHVTVVFTSNALAIPLKKEEKLATLKAAVARGWNESTTVEVVVESDSEDDEPAPGKKKPLIPVKPPADEDNQAEDRSNETIQTKSTGPGRFEKIEETLRNDDLARTLFDELNLEIETVRKFNEDELE